MNRRITNQNNPFWLHEVVHGFQADNLPPLDFAHQNLNDESGGGVEDTCVKGRNQRKLSFVSGKKNTFCCGQSSIVVRRNPSSCREGEHIGRGKKESVWNKGRWKNDQISKKSKLSKRRERRHVEGSALWKHNWLKLRTTFVEFEIPFVLYVVSPIYLSNIFHHLFRQVQGKMRENSEDHWEEDNTWELKPKLGQNVVNGRIFVGIELKQIWRTFKPYCGRMMLWQNVNYVRIVVLDNF